MQVYKDYSFPDKSIADWKSDLKKNDTKQLDKLILEQSFEGIEYPTLSLEQVIPIEIESFPDNSQFYALDEFEVNMIFKYIYEDVQ